MPDNQLSRVRSGMAVQALAVFQGVIRGDIPGRLKSSSDGCFVVPGDVFVVLGAGFEAAMEDADEPVRQLPQGSVVTDVSGPECVVVGPSARRCAER